MKRAGIAVLFACLLGAGNAGATPVVTPLTTVIRAARETSHFTFYASPRRLETECEPTTAKALLIHGARVAVPALFSNHAANGSVYIYERANETCVSLVNWTTHREIVHFALVLLNTTTRL